MRPSNRLLLFVADLEPDLDQVHAALDHVLLEQGRELEKRSY